MDHRFRLTPLSREAAEEAITAPAAIPDPDLATKPFRLDPELVTTILNHLTSSTDGGRSARSRYVEPFQLQLICQRIEQLVASKQKASSNEIIFNFKDLGGEHALRQILADFYVDAIRSVPEKRLRPAVRRLCEQVLISPEGRRLSIDGRELQRQLRLPRTTLSELVESGLLRTDRRSDSTYYELSHDSLVNAILARRRKRALVVGWGESFTGAFLCIVFGLAIFQSAWDFLKELIRLSSDTGGDAIGLIVYLTLIPFYLSVGFFGREMWRRGSEMRYRYRRRQPS